MDRKEQLIKEAWGKYWRKVESLVDSFGWLNVAQYYQFPEMEYDLQITLEIEEYRVRPKSLTGLEDNNGWTKINSADDLPKFKGMYTCGQLCEDGCFIRRGTVPSAELRELFRKGGATHFKEWKPDPMPMY